MLQAIALSRALHDLGYFLGVVENERQQMLWLEEAIDMVLARLVSNELSMLCITRILNSGMPRGAGRTTGGPIRITRSRTASCSS